MDNTKRLESEKISKLLWRFALPSVIGLLSHAVYNITDRIFVGQGIGEDGLAGVVHAFPIMLAHFSIAMLIGGGGAALISIRLGEKRRDLAERTFGNVIFLFVLAVVLLTALTLYFLTDLVDLMDVNESVRPYALEYMEVIFGGTGFILAAFVLTSLIRAEGSPNFAMWLLIIGSILNVIFDPILIFGFDMGVRGAALATVAAHVFMALGAVWYYAGGRSVLRLHRRYLRPCLKIITPILLLGLPACLMEMACALQIGELNWQLQVFGGKNAVGALGIVFAVEAFIFLPLMGVAEGVQPILGYNHGAKRYDRVRSALCRSLLYAMIFAAIGSVIVFVLARDISTVFFSEQNAVVDIAVRGMRIFVVLLPITAINMIGVRYFQAVGKAFSSLILSLCRQVVIFSACVFVLPEIFGLDGVWLSGPVSDFLASLLVGTLLYFEVRTLKRAWGRTAPASVPDTGTHPLR